MVGRAPFLSSTVLLSALFMIFSGPVSAARDVDWALYDAMLKKYTADGMVDYLRWKKDDLAVFEHYINGLAKASLTVLSENGRKAFWINAYNALTIYAVLKHIPVNGLLARVFSVRLIPGFFDKITYAVAGEALTLNDIENKKLREGFRDPRTHFVLVCASRSCPRLQNAAFGPEDLEKILDMSARGFLQDAARNRLDRKEGVLRLSEIFRWYASDFSAAAGSVLDYVKKYVSPEEREYLAAHPVTIGYLFYDWLLNIKR